MVCQTQGGQQRLTACVTKWHVRGQSLTHCGGRDIIYARQYGFYRRYVADAQLAENLSAHLMYFRAYPFSISRFSVVKILTVRRISAVIQSVPFSVCKEWGRGCRRRIMLMCVNRV